MGNSHSKTIKREIQRCVPHEICPDDEKQRDFLAKLRGRSFDKATIVNRSVTSDNITFLHYGVLLNTNPVVLIQFSTDDLKNPVIQATTTIGNGWRKDYELQLIRTDEKDHLINRAFNIMGSAHFSLILRNSEHVANYIVKSAWYSDAILRDRDVGLIYNGVNDVVRNKMNTVPSGITNDSESVTIITQRPLLQFMNKQKVKVELSHETTNILLIGPSGAGKSNIINYLLGRCVLKTRSGPNSQTEHTNFIQCIHGFDIFNLIDTVGSTDSSLNEEEVFQKLTYPLLSTKIYIHQVWIVLEFEKRFPSVARTTLIKCTEWLKQNKAVKNFKTIFTNCRNDISSNEKNKITQEFLDIFKTMSLPEISYTTVDLKDPNRHTEPTRNLDEIMRVFQQWLDERPEPLEGLGFNWCTIL